MRLIRLLLLWGLFLTGFLSLFAQTHSQKEIEALLVELDEAVAHKKAYQAMRQAHADSMEQVVSTCSPKDYVEKCKELYGAVADFDGKQTLQALERIVQTPQYTNDMNLQAWVKLNQSRTYATMGLYHKANRLTNEIDPNRLSADERLHYYHTCRSNNEKISEYMSDVDVVQDEERKTINYFDSILALQPAGVGRDITLINKEVYQGRPKEALKVALADLEKAEGKELLYLGMAMASIYEQLHEPTNHIYYLAFTAIDDIKNGTTEYQALPFLANALYEQKDIDRAYEYLMCTMEDANKYPSRSLALDVSRYFPLINQSYSNHKDFMVQAEKMKRNSYVITYIMLALAIFVALFLGWRYNNTRQERKRADELQKALDKAAIADRIKTVFIQNMRHEIRTPLNAIMGFAQLLSNDLSEEDRILYNGYIQESNRQLLSTLDDIIDVSNMEVGTFNFNFGDIDVDKLCRQQMEDVRELLPAGVEFVYQPLKQGLRLLSDQKRVGQVLHNLLSNACKNTTSGTITLSVAHYANSVQFVVTDTGCGIPPDKTEVIFEHFEKLDHYSPGLGLGLYVCRLIARALGGDIRLDTRYTTGARFVFSAPNHEASSAPSKPKLP